jgi:hypothetical protein
MCGVLMVLAPVCIAGLVKRECGGSGSRKPWWCGHWEAPAAGVQVGEGHRVLGSKGFGNLRQQ